MRECREKCENGREKNTMVSVNVTATALCTDMAETIPLANTAVKAKNYKLHTDKNIMMKIDRRIRPLFLRIVSLILTSSPVTKSLSLASMACICK